MSKAKSSRVARKTASRSSASTVVAPRTPRQIIAGPPILWQKKREREFSPFLALVEFYPHLISLRHQHSLCAGWRPVAKAKIKIIVTKRKPAQYLARVPSKSKAMISRMPANQLTVSFHLAQMLFWANHRSIYYFSTSSLSNLLDKIVMYVCCLYLQDG
jgi:hypothetical protein